MIHHSHVVCEDCGERHTPGNKEECIECLKEQIKDLNQCIISLNNALTAANDRLDDLDEPLPLDDLEFQG